MVLVGHMMDRNTMALLPHLQFKMLPQHMMSLGCAGNKEPNWLKIDHCGWVCVCVFVRASNFVIVDSL